jgi:hypothetical protein
VTANEPQFQGHFPGMPVFPGVYMVEAMAQTAAVIVGVGLGLADKRIGVYFMALDGVKFRRKVGPGDQLRMEVDDQARRRQGLEVRGPRHRGRGAGLRGRVHRHDGPAEGLTVAFIPTRASTRPPSSSPAPRSARAPSSARSAVIGPKVVLGEGVEVKSHAVVTGRPRSARGR